MAGKTIRHLNQLEMAGLVKLAKLQPELEYFFRHALVQETVYDSILRSDRRKLHRTVGYLIEQIHPEKGEELAPVLARHFLSAGEYDLAYPYLIKTGDLGLKRYALQEAIHAYSRAIEISVVAKSISTTTPEQDLHAYLQRGRAMELNAQYFDASKNYQELINLGSERSQPGLKLSGLMAKAALLSTPNAVHDPKEAEALAGEAHQLATQLGDRVAEARVYWILLLLNSRTNRPAEAVHYGEKALALTQETGHRELLAYVYNDIAEVYIITTQLAKAVDAYQQANRLWREMDNQAMLADNLSSSTFLEFFLGNYQESIQSADEANRISKNIGNLWGQAYSRMYVGYVYQELGEFATAVHVMEECISLSLQAGFIAPQAVTRGDLGFTYAYLGQFDHAFNLIEEALPFGENLIPWKPWLNTDLARIHILAGNPGEAERAITLARETLAEFDPIGFTTPLLILAENEYDLLVSNYEQVIKRVDEVTPLQRLGLKTYLPDVLYSKGKALAALGQTDQALSTLAEAKERAETIGSRRSIWPILCELSRLTREEGEETQARAFYNQALDVLDYISDHSQLPGKKIDFFSLPHVKPLIEAASSVSSSPVRQPGGSRRFPRL